MRYISLYITILLFIATGAQKLHSEPQITGLLRELLDTLPKAGESYIVETTTVCKVRGEYPGMITRVHVVNHGFAIETLTQPADSKEYAILSSVVSMPNGGLTLDYAAGYPTGLLEIYLGNKSLIEKDQEISGIFETAQISFLSDSLRIGIFAVDFDTLSVQDSSGSFYKGRRLEVYHSRELEMKIKHTSGAYVVSVLVKGPTPGEARITYYLTNGRTTEVLVEYGEQFSVHTRKKLTQIAHPSIPSTIEAWTAHYRQPNTVFIQKNLATGAEIQKFGENKWGPVVSAQKSQKSIYITWIIIFAISSAAAFSIWVKNKNKNEN